MPVIPFSNQNRKSADEDSFQAQLKKLEHKQDDFSIRVVLDGDPLFFIRVEPGMGNHLLFTDFKPGNSLPGVLGHAIDEVLTACSHRGSLLFQNVYPAWRSDPVGAVELQNRIQQLKSELALVEGYSPDTTVFRSEESRGKINLLVTPGA
ncbi:MAG: hypothetical protein RIA09_19500 [Hoeflea sp.]|uniref:hypothetical protein n=1 Tax=Hoeflea sp. TaxID=1940281 RepID=UPI0032EBC286